MPDTRQGRLGILGGGQLARLLLLAASGMGLEVAVMEGAADSPAGRLTRHEVVGGWDDETALRRLADLTSTVVLENEFVPARSLALLESWGVEVLPGSAALGVVQDKYAQKERLRASGLPLPPFRAVASVEDVLRAAGDWGWPLVLKRRRNGYDGYGNRVLHAVGEVAAAVAALGGLVSPTEEGPGRDAAGALMVEGHVSFVRELAVMVAVARGGDGPDTRVYPVVETVQRGGICHAVYAPAGVPPEVARRAAALAREAVAACGLRGVAGVELFETGDGDLVINELAPRVHNSGHYTIEGCVTSQFENAVRAALGLPLGETALVAPAAAMVNLLGSAHAQPADGRPSGLHAALAVPGAHVHLYGKRQSRAGRKMGHVTALGATVEQAGAVAARAAALLHL